MKRIRLLSLLVLVALFLTGCLAPSLRLTIFPNPIKVTVDQSELKDLKLKVNLSGFSLGYEVKTAEVVLRDAEGEVKKEATQTIDKKFPVAPGISRVIDLGTISLEGIEELTPELYDEHFKGETWTLTVTLTGTKDSTATANIVFE